MNTPKTAAVETLAKTVLVGLGYGLIIVVLIMVVIGQERAAENRNQLRDCIELTGDCYQQGQERTAKVVGSINTNIVNAAWCARQSRNVTVAKVRACVTKLGGPR